MGIENNKDIEKTQEQNIEKNETKPENQEQINNKLNDIENNLKPSEVGIQKLENNPDNEETAQKKNDSTENKEKDIENKDKQEENIQEKENKLKSIEEDLQPKTENKQELEEVRDISKLENTENFRQGALEHIFEGEINRRGDAVGFHKEGMDSSKGRIIDGTETMPNEQGVYQGKVEIDGVEKTGNGGYSTFFPKDLSPQEVVDSINEAYDSRVHDCGNTYIGTSDSGLEIGMYIDSNDKIISAFPILDEE